MNGEVPSVDFLQWYNGQMSTWGTEFNLPVSWLEGKKKNFSVQQATYSTDITYFYWKTT